MKSIADYMLTFDLGFKVGSFMLLTFCNDFLLVNGHSYVCYLSMGQQYGLTCRATSTSTIQIEMTNASIPLSTAITEVLNYTIVILSITNPSL